MIEYAVLSGLGDRYKPDASRFSSLVTDYLSEGWDLYGPLTTMIDNEYGTIHYSQVVTKKF